MNYSFLPVLMVGAVIALVLLADIVCGVVTGGRNENR